MKAEEKVMKDEQEALEREHKRRRNLSRREGEAKDKKGRRKLTGRFFSSQTIIKRGGPQSEDPGFRALYKNKFVSEVKAEYIYQ